MSMRTMQLRPYFAQGVKSYRQIQDAYENTPEWVSEWTRLVHRSIHINSYVNDQRVLHADPGSRPVPKARLVGFAHEAFRNDDINIAASVYWLLGALGTEWIFNKVNQDKHSKPVNLTPEERKFELFEKKSPGNEYKLREALKPEYLTRRIYINPSIPLHEPFMSYFSSLQRRKSVA